MQDDRPRRRRRRGRVVREEPLPKATPDQIENLNQIIETFILNQALSSGLWHFTASRLAGIIRLSESTIRNRINWLSDDGRYDSTAILMLSVMWGIESGQLARAYSYPKMHDYVTIFNIICIADLPDTSVVSKINDFHRDRDENRRLAGLGPMARQDPLKFEAPLWVRPNEHVDYQAFLRWHRQFYRDCQVLLYGVCDDPED